MIGKKYQKKGYGKIAMIQVLEILKIDKEHSRVYISFEPENQVAKKLHESLGFTPDDRIIDGEIVYCLNYTI